MFGPRRLSTPTLLALLCAAAGASRPVHAQEPAGAATFPPPRPTFQVALGMGASIDHNERHANPDAAVPSFFFAAGLGEGLWGLEVRSFANGATSGQVSRVSLELLGVVRPLAPVFDGHRGYGQRVLRSISVAAGPGVERLSLALDAAARFGASVGAHVDLPVGPAGANKEMRFRLSARRMFGAKATVGELAVSDTKLELFGQLAFVF